MNFLPKGRLDAFADGVFAIVITLLVLDLVVPEAPGDLLRGLLQEWPVFLAYLISFAFIGSLWISHSSVTHLMRQETAHSYRLTLMMLFFVSLLPFTTKLMATHLGQSPVILVYFTGSDFITVWVAVNTVMRSAISTPVTIYGLNLLAATLALIAIMRSAISTPDMLVSESAKNELLSLAKREQLGVFIILGTLVFAVFFPLIAVSGFIVVSILFFLTPTLSTAKATLKKK